MKIWKVGLVGTGWWSEKHLKAWVRIPGAEVAALCNRSRGKLKDKAARFHIPEHRLYHSIDEMLANSDIDIVDIATGPETHLEFVEKAAAAGKHIMCQKPFALTLADAENMVCAAKEANVRLMVTENWRWLQPFQTIKSVIDGGSLGRLSVARYIHTDYYTPRMTPDAELPQPFFRKMPKLLFYEMGTHWFDTWRFLFGTPKRLYAETLRISPYIVGEDTGIVTLGYDHFYGFLDMSWATRQRLVRPPEDRVYPAHLEQLSIDGENGTLKLYASGKITVINREGDREKVIKEAADLDHEESHFKLQSHFIDSLNRGVAFQTGGEDHLTTLRMVFGVYDSAVKHESVILEGE